MEFGQRALGNRSILADPRDYNNIKKINDKIKRDFWMPFTLRYYTNTRIKFLLIQKFILHL